MDLLILGCGNKPVAGAVNHDRIRHREEIDIAWDLNDLPWPWEDESFDRVHANAVLEHLRLNLVESLNECWRILRPGGTLYVKLPHWKHDTSYMDPTHYWQYSVRALDVFDPATEFGRRYAFYTDRKWRLVKGPMLNKARSSIVATLEKRGRSKAAEEQT
jgi:SAM-dependent methyltransferase